MSNEPEQRIDREYDHFTGYLIPFGSMDIRSAVTTSIEAGFDGNWAGEQVDEMMEATGMPLGDLDPCYCVYDSILQIARNQIEELTGHDFVNDQKEIYTYGNFMCTAYDYEQEAIDELTKVLEDKEIAESDLDDATRWFLNEISINLAGWNYEG